MTYFGPSCLVLLLAFKAFAKRPCKCVRRLAVPARRGVATGSLNSSPLLGRDGAPASDLVALIQPVVDCEGEGEGEGGMASPTVPTESRLRQGLSSGLQILYLLGLVGLGDCVLVVFMFVNTSNAGKLLVYVPASRPFCARCYLVFSPVHLSPLPLPCLHLHQNHYSNTL
jgi:hypothetical protein